MDLPLGSGLGQSSRTVLGWVKPGDSADEATSFQENPRFLELLHESIANTLATPGSDPLIENEAAQRGEGWLHINDQRNIAALNRVGDPDDIIGTVMVRDGKILASTYQPMPSYRVCTSDGLTRLSDGLNSRLLEDMLKERARENQTA